jgi:hypothetical protein
MQMFELMAQTERLPYDSGVYFHRRTFERSGSETLSKEAIMAEDKEKTDWTHVNNAIQKRRADASMPATSDLGSAGGPLAPRNSLGVQTAGSPPNLIANPEGIIARFKMNQVAKKAAISHLESWYGAQLDVVRHQLSEVARAKKAETTLLADQFLSSINAQHLSFLADLGLKNEGARSAALIKLADQTAATLKEIATRDWPESIREQTINGVIERNQRFFSKLVNELGD